MSDDIWNGRPPLGPPEAADPAADAAKLLPKTENEMPNGASIEMPRYRSHKQVWALKIARIDKDSDTARAENRDTDGSAIITPAEQGYAPFKVDHAYMSKHTPKAGGYYVVYADGYKSWSPAEAFESGYTRVNP